jgi:hypothetical protein
MSFIEEKSSLPMIVFLDLVTCEYATDPGITDSHMWHMIRIGEYMRTKAAG